MRNSPGGGIQERLGLLEEIALVGGAAALGDEEELVLGAGGGVEVDLGREVGAGVDLLVHVEGHGLGVAEVLLGVGLVDPSGEVLLVLHAGPDLLALLADDGGGAGVLAEGELELGGDLGVRKKAMATPLSFMEASGSREDLATISLCSGRSRKETSRMAWLARKVSADGLTFSISFPSNRVTDTPYSSGGGTLWCPAREGMDPDNGIL